MQRIILIFVIILICVERRAVAQTAIILPMIPVTGSIDAAEDTMRWSFFALQNDVVSLHLEGEDGLDPVLQLVDEQGQAVIANDDYKYPDSRNALLEAITIARTGTYDVVVSSFGETTGDFTLTLIPGFAQLDAGPDVGDVEWDEVGEIFVTPDSDSVVLEVSGLQERGALINAEAGPYENFYTRINVTGVEGRSGWVVGLALRWQPNNSYYAVEVSSQDVWRMVAVDGGEVRIVRDWTSHPALLDAAAPFQVAVLATGTMFEVFFNGQLVGSVSDDTIPSGRAGIALAGTDAIDSLVTATVDEMMISVPLLIGGQRVFPNALVQGNASQVVHELERRGVIPPNGQQALSVSESFIERRTSGVDTLTLGRGARFRNFALSTMVSLERQDEGLAGCGIMVQHTADDAYVVAFKDARGGYGLSRRTGETFSSGVFNERTDWAGLEQDNLLVIVMDDQIHYFVNGSFAGTLETPSVEGLVGNAILNYDSTSAVCRFSDMWLWQWS